STTTSRCFVCCITAAVASISASSPLSMERIETGWFQANPSLRRLLQQNRHESEVRHPVAHVGYRGKSGQGLKDAVRSADDAVDGAHSAASKCHRVVASKRTT